MKFIRYDRHAKRRMKERDVAEEEAKMAINSPDYIEPSVKGRKNGYKLIGSRFLRVTFKEDQEEILVITVTVRKRPFRG